MADAGVGRPGPSGGSGMINTAGDCVVGAGVGCREDGASVIGAVVVGREFGRESGTGAIVARGVGTGIGDIGGGIGANDAVGTGGGIGWSADAGRNEGFPLGIVEGL